MGDFKDLRVWRMAHEIAVEMYRLTRGFPPEERFGLSSQVRRAASSVSANIAESRGRRTDADRRRFLEIAQGSAVELESHILLVRDVGLMSPEDAINLLAQIASVQRMLAGLIGHKR